MGNACGCKCNEIKPTPDVKIKEINKQIQEKLKLRKQLEQNNKKIQQSTKKIEQSAKQLEQSTKVRDITQLNLYLRLFNLPQNLADNISNLNATYLKQTYRIRIDAQRSNPKTRRVLNLAFEYLNRKFYQPSYSNQQLKLINAFLGQNLQQLNQILIRKPSLIHFRQKNSNYPLLYLAVRIGCYELVEFILNKKVNFDFSKDKSTPMHCAAYYGHYQIIGLLVRYGIPLNIKNSHGALPIQDAKTDAIKQLIQNAQKDNIHNLITQLQKQKFFLTQLTIKHKSEEVVRKIILNDYQRTYNSHDDAFHGTKFQNLFSIAKNGLKKPGDSAGDIIIQIAEDHYKDPNWAQRIFSSPSIFYAGCSFYSKDIQFINTRNNKKQFWLPIVQVKLKKNTYQTHITTSSARHTPRPDEPIKIEYISSYQTQEQRMQKVTVVALIFVKKSFLDNGMNYKDVTNTILNSEQQSSWRTHYMKHKK